MYLIPNQQVELNKALAQVRNPGPVLTPSRPVCVKCKQPKPILGSKRFINKFGRYRFICKECKDEI